MPTKPPKKGPHRMTTACKPETRDDVARRELSKEVDAFAQKAHNAIQEARSKMTEEERQKADQEAKKILDRATSTAKSSQHTA